jgi:hypothetical protein
MKEGVSIMIPIRIIRYLIDFLILLSIYLAVLKNIGQNNLKYTEYQSVDDSYDLGYRIFM